MKNCVKNERGVTLISLAVAIIIIGIITSMLLYNVKDTKDIERVSNMYVDIEAISDRVSNYYSKYGALPLLRDIDLSGDSTILEWISERDSTANEGPLGKNDSNTFYVIDLEALENLSLNYGSGFSRTELPENKDVYIINENSHNIFYLQGIKINNNGVIKMYYTNLDRDSEKVNIRYVAGIKIPDGFSYKSGSTKNDLKIEDQNNIEYSWANTGDSVYIVTETQNGYKLKNSNTMSSDIVFGSNQNADDFIASAREFGGFYFKDGSVQDTVDVYYFSVSEDDNWGQPYDVTGTYVDRNGDKAYIPAGFRISKLSTLNTINKGLVIKNGTTGDEYVWIDVPDNVLANARSLEEMENALKEYTKDYRKEECEDDYCTGLIMTDDETKNNKVVYNELKNKMLQSIKQNGGFYIGRYEAGKNNTDNLVSQKDMKPFNSVLIKSAQELASNQTTNNYNTSLMFGLQWDLACKFIEENGAKSFDKIANNSTDWGNYDESNVLITSNNAQKFAQNNWENISKGTYKSSGSINLLTTRASEDNKVLNIYDFAGNCSEMTLEKNKTTNKMVSRGGAYIYGADYPVAVRVNMELDSNTSDIGFRVTLFK